MTKNRNASTNNPSTTYIAICPPIFQIIFTLCHIIFFITIYNQLFTYLNFQYKLQYSMSALNPNNSSGPLIQNNPSNKRVDRNEQKKKKKKKNLIDISKQNEAKQKQMTSAEIYLKNILTNKLLFSESFLDESIFKTDLVMELKLPKEIYLKRKQKLELGQFMRKFPEQLHNAYEAAYRELFQDMEIKGDAVHREKHNDKQLRLRNLTSFNKISKDQIMKKLASNQNEFNKQMHQYMDINAYSKLKKVYTETGYEQYISLNCTDQYTGMLDAFIINYNTIIYALQQICGFRVKSFMITKEHDRQKGEELERINIIQGKGLQSLLKIRNKMFQRRLFILLYLPDQLLIKAANKHGIKKQIDYMQIDPFLNQPMDKTKRPLRFNSQIKKELQKIFKEQQKQSHQNSQQIKKQTKKQEKARISGIVDLGLSVWNKKPDKVLEKQEKDFRDINFLIKKKSVDRKLGFNLYDYDRSFSIIREESLSERAISNYMQFHLCLNRQLKFLTGNKPKHNCFNDPDDPDAVTQEQKEYLLNINRYKYNLGVQKRYVQIKKQRKYFEILKNLSKSFRYPIFQTPIMHTQFSLVNKKKKYFSRLQHMLLFKQMTVSPYGELSLFLKMQRIKLSYAVLRQVIRIQNLHLFRAKIFALHNNYQKQGQILDKNSSRFSYFYKDDELKTKNGINGGLNGRNLEQDWSALFVWKTNYNTLKNYLGQAKTFQFVIKTNMVILFAFLAPFGIVFEIIKKVWISPQSAVVAYFPQFYFYIGYMFLASVIYAIFLQKFQRIQQNYIKDFVEEDPFIQFRNQYRGPYMRDTKNDNANTYAQNNQARSCFRVGGDRLKIFFTFLVFFLILAFQIGFYYGMRALIVELSYQFPQQSSSSFYLIKPIHLLAYAIYFLSNEILYTLFIIRLAKFLTKLQNRPTEQQFFESENLKLYIFQIVIEIIGPIDLVFIQYAEKSSCSSSWCAREVQNYVYSRYIIFFAVVLFYLCNMIRIYIKSKTSQIFLEGQKEQNSKYARRLSKFLEFVYDESKKQPCADIKLVDQTVALIHFATFLTVFPLGTLFSFGSMMIDYITERLQIFRYYQRPIAKSQGFQSYRNITVAISHWMLFFNFSHMFITLEWLQYLFPTVITSILTTPTPYTLMTLKYGTILLFMIIYEIIIAIVIHITKRNHTAIDLRKWKMLQKYQIKILNSGGNVVLKQPKPLYSISRTYKVKTEKINDLTGSDKQNQSQDDQSEYSHQSPNTYTQLSNIKHNEKKSMSRIV